MKRFLRDQGEASSLFEPFAKILQRGTDLAGKASLGKLLSCGTRIAPHGRKNKIRSLWVSAGVAMTFAGQKRLSVTDVLRRSGENPAEINKRRSNFQSLRV